MKEVKINISITISRRHFFILSGLLILIALTNLSSFIKADISNGVYHNLRDIVTDIGGGLENVATSDGYINSKFLKITRNLNMNGHNVVNANQVSANTIKEGGSLLSDKYAIKSHTHDTRYYTKGQSDSRFLNVAGDTMYGDLNMNGYSVVNANKISGNQLCIGTECKTSWSEISGGCVIEGRRVSDGVWVILADAASVDTNCFYDWGRNCYKLEVVYSSGFRRWGSGQRRVTKNGALLGVCTSGSDPKTSDGYWISAGTDGDYGGNPSAMKQYCENCLGGYGDVEQFSWYWPSGCYCTRVTSDCRCTGCVPANSGSAVKSFVCCKPETIYDGLRVRCGSNTYYY